MDLRQRYDSLCPPPVQGPGTTVKAPPVHEGVGTALRNAYVPHSQDIIPEDMIELLLKLR
jgi:hypothetical protein